MLGLLHNSLFYWPTPKPIRAVVFFWRTLYCNRRADDDLSKDLLRLTATRNVRYRRKGTVSIPSPVFAGTAPCDVGAIPEEEILGRSADNDRLRMTFEGGRIFLTEGVWALGLSMVDQVLAAVRAFDDFTIEDDPRGEHGCGHFEIAGTRFVWRIADETEIECEDAIDQNVSTRVLAIMLAEEY